MNWFIREVNWGKSFLVAILFFIFSMVVRQIEVMLTIKYYMMPEYFGTWSKVMMPGAGPPPPSFFITSAVFTLATGLSITMIYYYVRKMLPKSFIKRTFFFADLMIATSFIFFTLPVYLLFNVPFALLVSWFISSFIILVGTSFIIVRIIN